MLANMTWPNMTQKFKNLQYWVNTYKKHKPTHFHLWRLFKYWGILKPEAAQCCSILENSMIFTVSDNTLKSYDGIHVVVSGVG